MSATQRESIDNRSAATRRRLAILLTVGALLHAPGPGSSGSGPVALAAGDATSSLAWAPPESVALLVLRPARLLARPDMTAVTRALDKAGGLADQLGVSLTDVEQALLVFMPGQATGTPPRLAGMAIHTRTPQNAVQLAGHAVPQGVPRKAAGHRYLVGPGGNASFAQGPICLIADREADLQSLLAAGPAGANGAAWSGRWNEIATNDIACLIDVKQLRAALNRQFAGPPLTRLPFGALAPLWMKSRWTTLSLRGDQGLRLSGQIDCTSAAAAQSVAETLTATIVLLRNILEPLLTRQQPRGIRGASALEQQTALLASGILADFRVTTSGTRVELAAAPPIPATAQLLALAIPAVQVARQAARRTQSANNLKQIALAFHNYYNIHNRFPTTVMLGPDGKTPHSWRVAILPFLEADPLYDQYRLDEPWDSEHNRRLLTRMPNTYRHPSDPPGSTVSSYYGLSGQTSVFAKQGLTFRQIIDGTSNTVLVVEARRRIPWTKPQDIPFVPATLPQLGGYQDEGFQAAFCDGSVRFIAKSVDDEILRRYFQFNDRQPIPQR